MPRIVWIFIGFVGWATAFCASFPIFPQILVELCDGNFAEASRVSGNLSACNALANFLTLPLLGLLSDKWGRKPILCLGLVGHALDMATWAFTPSLWPLYVSRTLSGCINGIFPATFAMIADVSDPKSRSKDFGLIGVGFGLGMLVGQVGGGFIGDKVALRAPIIVGLALLGLDLLYLIILMPETKKKDERPLKLSRANPLRSFSLLLKHRMALGMALIYGVMFLAEEGMYGTFILFLQFRFHFGTFQIGLLLALVGVCSILVQGGVLRLVINAIGEQKTLLAGLAVNAMTGWVYGVIPKGMWYLLYPLLFVRAFSMVSGPIMQGIISKQYSDDQQGEILGVLASLKTVTELAGPLIFNNLFSFYISSSAYPFQIPGIVFFVASLDWVFCLVLTAILFKVCSTHFSHFTETDPLLGSNNAADFHKESVNYREQQ